MRIAPIAAALVLSGTSAQAATVDIDLNDFFADPEVTVAVDGSSADFVESQFESSVILNNDPFLGDPNVILPGVGTSLTFDYNFNETTGGEDEFLAFLFDSDTGLGLGAPFEFIADSTSSGTVSFNLGTLVGTTLGLSFEMNAQPGDATFDSTLTVSNVQLVTALTDIPLPAGGLLLLGGLGALGAMRRRPRN